MRMNWNRNRTSDSAELAEKVQTIAHGLADASSLDPLLERIGDAKYVLLGEASHGTSDYYTWRARISQRLITEKGFSFVAVEGDWPDCYRVNRYIKGRPGSGSSAQEVLHTFSRWPTWMWANWEVVAFTEWLRGHNNKVAGEADKVGFYGLDVYSLWESLGAVTDYLQRTDPEALEAAKRAYRCFEPYAGDEQDYARATALVPTSCEREVVDLLSTLRRRANTYPDDHEARFDAERNAKVAVGAERYYRAMVRGGPESWNIRDRHMVDTLDSLIEHHGSEAKAIVWEHNTHIGDARATPMASGGMVNVGQLVREGHDAENTVLVGFGSHRGSVVAGEAWGAPMERMEVPPAREGSWEEILHGAELDKALLLSDSMQGEAFSARRAHRAIGVVYHPSRERYGNYVPTTLPERYDAFIYIDETKALHPLHLEETEERPELYPWGV